MYYTYIVASRSHNFYIEMTSDLQKRVWEHKEGVYEGYSKQYNCNRLVWSSDVRLSSMRSLEPGMTLGAEGRRMEAARGTPFAALDHALGRTAEGALPAIPCGCVGSLSSPVG